jgi:hypothetical protein
MVGRRILEPGRATIEMAQRVPLQKDPDIALGKHLGFTSRTN